MFRYVYDTPGRYRFRSALHGVCSDITSNVPPSPFLRIPSLYQCFASSSTHHTIETCEAIYTRSRNPTENSVQEAKGLNSLR
jgi:hypothetical protein